MAKRYPKAEHEVKRNTMVQYMRRLGYVDVHARRVKDSAERLYRVTAYDMASERPFDRVYSVEDMACITRAGAIFWRYVQ